MSGHDNDDDNDDGAGYGKPPRSGQFQKGKSGNPKGRPRKPKPKALRFSDMPSLGFRETETYRPITLRENGQPVELPAIQAVDRAAHALALRGNRLQQKYLLERAEREEKEAFALKMERYRELRDCKRRGEELLAEHERNGTPPPDLLPHPEDIVLNPATGDAFVNGPETPEDVRFYEHSCELRNHMMLRDVHGDRTRTSPMFLYGDKELGLWLFLAQIIDLTLPRRFRWRDNEEVVLMVEYQLLTKKQRERRIADEYAHLMATLPRATYMTPESRLAIDKMSEEFLAGMKQRQKIA